MTPALERPFAAMFPTFFRLERFSPLGHASTGTRGRFPLCHQFVRNGKLGPKLEQKAFLAVVLCMNRDTTASIPSIS